MPGVDALETFANRWRRASDNMITRRPNPEFSVGATSDRQEQAELGELLAARADLLLEFSQDDAIWS